MVLAVGTPQGPGLEHYTGWIGASHSQRPRSSLGCSRSAGALTAAAARPGTSDGSGRMGVASPSLAAGLDAAAGFPVSPFDMPSHRLDGSPVGAPAPAADGRPASRGFMSIKV